MSRKSKSLDEARSKYKFSRRVRRLLQRDGHRCWLCGEPFLMGCGPDNKLAPTLDHVIERRNRGWDSSDNLRLAHRKCNNARRIKFAHTNNDPQAVSA